MYNFLGKPYKLIQSVFILFSLVLVFSGHTVLAETDEILPIFTQPVVKMEGNMVTITVGVKDAASDVTAKGIIVAEGNDITAQYWPAFILKNNETMDLTWDRANFTDTKFYFRIWGETGDATNRKTLNNIAVHFEFPYEKPFPYFTDPILSQKGDVFSFTFTTNNAPDGINVRPKIWSKAPDTIVYEWNPIFMHDSQTKTLSWKSPGFDGKKYAFGLSGATPNNLALTDRVVQFTAQEEIIAPPPNCLDFSDVEAYDCEVVTWVKEKGIMLGYDNGKFGPDDFYNRAQNVVTNLRAGQLYDNGKEYCNGSNPFPDVSNNVILWAYQPICQAKGLNMVEGYTAGPWKGMFRPGQEVTSEEALAMSLRILLSAHEIPDINSSSYPGVPAGQWYSGYLKYAYDHDLAPDFQLGKPMTRLQVAKLFYQLGQLGEI